METCEKSVVVEVRAESTAEMVIMNVVVVSMGMEIEGSTRERVNTATGVNTKIGIRAKIWTNRKMERRTRRTKG